MNTNLKHVLFVGKNRANEFLRIFEDWKIPVEIIALDEFPKVNPARYASVFFMPGYFEWDKNLAFKYDVLKMLKRFRDLGKGFYAEYVQADDYLLADAFIFKQNYPPRPAGLERIFVAKNHYVTRDFTELTILPVRNCSFLPGQRRAQILLAFASMLGAYQAFDLPPVDKKTGNYLSRHIWPALLSLEGRTQVVGEGGISLEGRKRLFATFELSRFREKNFPLAHYWERIARRIVLCLLPEGERKKRENDLIPIKAVSRKRAAKALRPAISERNKLYRHALNRVIKWYLQSGVMPASDGTRGVYEGFRSVDHKLIPVYRTDCNSESALALFLYGRLAGKNEYCRKAKNIFSFLWKTGWQDMDPARETCGLWKFYDDFEDFTAVAYANDNGETGRALFFLYRLTGDKRFLKSAVLTAEKFLALQFHLKQNRVEGRELNRLGLAGYLREQKAKGNYRDYLVNSDAGILYLYAYQATGEKKYLAAVEESFTVQSPSDIFLISFLYRLTNNNIYLRRLEQAITALKKTRLPAGCFLPAAHQLHKTNALYGLSEVDVRHNLSEPITDQLYCNAKAALNLYSAYRVTGNNKYKEIFCRLMDFLTAIQIKSPDKRLDGAWMRAFDCRAWDYYGSNGDVDWGPYCIESGWTNAWIAMALALYLQDASLI